MVLTQLTSTLATEQQKLLACVHCGLCLEACPTYVATGDENDGPRGRLYLMRAVDEGRLTANSETFERHIDRCLGCRACESVCPAGVEYGQLLEASRGELFASSSDRGFSYALLRFALQHVWEHPARLRLFFAMSRLFRDLGLPKTLRKLGLARLFSRKLAFALALLESSASEICPTPSKSLSANAGEDARAPSVAKPQSQLHSSRQSGSGMLFRGCVGEGLFARVNRATVRVLATNGIELRPAEQQVCCGALHAHAGDLEGARRLARQNIEAFGDGDDPIITNAGGCGAMLKTYAHLLHGDESYLERAAKFSHRVCDVSQQLAKTTGVMGSGIASTVVTYDASCHLMYGQRAADSSLAMMRSIPDLQFIPLTDYERCCGGAGVYNLLEPDLSGTVLNEKLARIRESGAEVVATGNPGCQMHIGAGAKLAGMELKVCHPIELVDESYRRARLYDEDGPAP